MTGVDDLKPDGRWELPRSGELRAGSRTWRYQAWGGQTRTVTAHAIEFTPTHVVWRDGHGAVVFADRPESINRLSQDGADGHASNAIPQDDQ